ncbi:SDR family NAD(P)-dependent oxidoreductase [Paracoccus kondratievae]|uniref:Diacetyl reductase n=1 Tax=Paracoccus kondratievae TaxID=135740 RepID=A0AAD3NZS9_9RHOB|nr:glucose 1-dehydrogenase [Paracoccus kondratievae]GLK64355.1 diacetyl reductase [Paracoccus kondratievae]
MSNSVKGRSVIVTGAGRGIGRAIAAGLAQAGAHVVIADIAIDSAEATAAEIRADGGQAIGLAVDVTDRTSMRELIARTVAEYGRLDAMFNNAGIAQVKPFSDITEEDWHRVMDVNAMGVLIGIQEAAKQFIAQGGGGKIVNTASIAGKQGYEPLAHYSASKFAVVALTQAAARAFGSHGICVNAICPGVVATDMWKLIDRGFKDEGLTQHDNQAFDEFSAGILLGRPSRPDDLAGVSVFLVSDGSNYMTGQSLVVDGGMVLI